MEDFVWVVPRALSQDHCCVETSSATASFKTSAIEVDDMDDIVSKQPMNSEKEEKDAIFVYVHVSDDNILRIHTFPWSTVGDVKWSVASHMGFPAMAVDQFRLTTTGSRTLSECSRLSECGIKDSTTLLLHGRLLGGSSREQSRDNLVSGIQNKLIIEGRPKNLPLDSRVRRDASQSQGWSRMGASPMSFTTSSTSASSLHPHSVADPPMEEKKVPNGQLGSHKRVVRALSGLTASFKSLPTFSTRASSLHPPSVAVAEPQMEENKVPNGQIGSQNRASSTLSQLFPPPVFDATPSADPPMKEQKVPNGQIGSQNRAAGVLNKLSASFKYHPPAAAVAVARMEAMSKLKELESLVTESLSEEGEDYEELIQGINEMLSEASSWAKRRPYDPGEAVAEEPNVEVHSDWSNGHVDEYPYHVDEVLQGGPPTHLKKPQGLRPATEWDPDITPEEKGNFFPAKSRTELNWYYLTTTHHMTKELRNSVIEFIKQPDFNANDLPTQYRLKQLREAFPMLKLMANEVGLSQKAVDKQSKEKSAQSKAQRDEKRNLKREARLSRRLNRGSQGDDSDTSDDNDSDELSDDLEHGITAGKKVFKVPFYDLIDVIKRIIQWPGNLENYHFLPESSDGGRSVQLINGSIYRSLPQFTATSISFSDSDGMKKAEHGSHVWYDHKGDRWLGEVTGIFQLGDPGSWKDVTGRSFPGDLDDALRRMHAAGGGPGGEPLPSVPLACRVRPYMKLCGLRTMGVVHGLDGKVVEESQDQHEGKDVELFAMFDLEHVVKPSEIISLANIARSSQEAQQDSFSNECYYSTRSVLRTAELDRGNAVQHFTVFESDSLPKPLYQLYQSPELKKRLANLPEGVTVLRVFIVYFYDGFNIYSKLMHSTGAGYITLGGLPLHLQDLLRNLIPIHLVPPGADLRESLEPFLARVLQLQEGIHVHMGDILGSVFLIGGLGLIRADMPQGQWFAGSLSQTANFGCRRCTTHKKDFDKVLSPMDAARVIRTIQGTQATRAKSMAAKAASKAASVAQTILTSVGLGPKESIFADSKVHFDPIRQCPYEPFHSEKIGFAKKFLSAFCASMEPDAFTQLNERIKRLATFPGWPNKVKPIQITASDSRLGDRHVKMNGTQAGMVCSVLPLIVRGWLKKSRFRYMFTKQWEEKIGDRWLEHLQMTVTLVARSNAACYAAHHPGDDAYDQYFHTVLKSARHACSGFWYNKFKNPTMHLASHHPETKREMGALRNTKGSKGEAKHQQVRFGALHLNGQRSVEIQMMFDDNQRHAGLFMAHGGYIHFPKKDQPGKAFKLAVRHPFIKKLLARTASSKTYAGEVNGKDDIVASDSNFEVGKEIKGPALLKGLINLFACKLEGIGSIDARREAQEALKAMKDGSENSEYLDPDMQSKYMSFYTRVDVASRPSYCRRIAWSRFYTVKTPVVSGSHRTVASARVARVDVILRFANTFWAMVTWMKELEIQDISDLKVLETGERYLCVLEDVLEPRYVVHRCDRTCSTGGPGFVGACGETNEYLDNAYVIL